MTRAQLNSHSSAGIRDPEAFCAEKVAEMVERCEAGDLPEDAPACDEIAANGQAHCLRRIAHAEVRACFHDCRQEARAGFEACMEDGDREACHEAGMNGAQACHEACPRPERPEGEEGGERGERPERGGDGDQGGERPQRGGR